MTTKTKNLACPYLRTAHASPEILEGNTIGNHRAAFILSQGLIVKIEMILISEVERKFSVTEISESEKKELCRVGAPFPNFGFMADQYVWVSYRAVHELGKQNILNDLPTLLEEKRKIRMLSLESQDW